MDVEVVECPRCQGRVRQKRTGSGHGEAYGVWRCECGLETDELYMGEEPKVWYLRQRWRAPKSTTRPASDAHCAYCGAVARAPCYAWCATRLGERVRGA